MEEEYVQPVEKKKTKHFLPLILQKLLCKTLGNRASFELWFHSNTIYSGSTVTPKYQSCNENGEKFKPIIVIPCVNIISSIHFMFHLVF